MIWSLLYRLDKLSRGCILCSAKRVWLVAGVICESGANQIPNGSDGSLMALQMAPALDDMALAVQDVRLERHLRWFANSRVLSTPSTAHSDDRLQMHFYQIYFYCFPFNTPHDRRCRKSTVLSSLVSSLNAKFFQHNSFVIRHPESDWRWSIWRCKVYDSQAAVIRNGFH